MGTECLEYKKKKRLITLSQRSLHCPPPSKGPLCYLLLRNPAPVMSPVTVCTIYFVCLHVYSPNLLGSDFIRAFRMSALFT